MSDLKCAPVCGIDCGACKFLGEQCKGCGHEEGKPFWAAQIPGGICPLYECCHNQKRLEHCGTCIDFPCKMFTDLRDPNMTDEEFQESLSDRLTSLKRRAEVGTQKWLVEKTANQP
jgi:hypothetical protein